jgi:hypothetical protein
MTTMGTGAGADRSDAAAPVETASRWYVEVLDKAGWQPSRRTLGRISYYACYEDAVAAAVREWERSDRPARPARIAPD